MPVPCLQLTTLPTPINTLDVAWTEPASTGGSAITGYQVEWWRADTPIVEVQTIAMSNSAGAVATTGTWTLALYGVKTVALEPAISAYVACLGPACPPIMPGQGRGVPRSSAR
jgi:hypothetical protein